MIVIAQICNSGYQGSEVLVKATVGELQHLSKSESKMTVGTEIKVDEMYSRFHQIVANKTRTARIRENCNDILKSLEKVEKLVEPEAATS